MSFLRSRRWLPDRVLARLRPWRFELRLAATLAVSLAAVLGAIQIVTADALTDELIKSDATHHAADARAVEAAYAQAPEGDRPIDEAAEVVRTMARRPGVASVALVDERRVVVAASDPASLGEREENPYFDAALRHGRSFAGRESEEDDAEERSSRLEFVVPLRLGGRPFAIEVDESGREHDAQLGEVRRVTTVVCGLGLLLAFTLFYLLGGRSLSRRHRSVLKRATQDPLTELGNHRAFQEELQRAQSFAARREEPFAVALVDLDDFKFINDRRGHRHGDEVLVEVARVLNSGRPEDRAFRIGGDEFAVLFQSTDGAGARIALERMLAAAQRGSRPATFTAGVASTIPLNGDDPGVTWEQADAALYEGKRVGGQGIVVFDDVAELLSVVTPAKVRALRALLDEPRLDIAFQPIVRLHDQSVLGFEALARPWEGYGFEGPADAFAVAEKVGRAHELDNICRAATLARAGEVPRDALLFLNVHPQTLDHELLDGDRLVRAVTGAGLEPAQVVLEITERSQVRLAQVIAGAAQLRSLGFRLGLDDVGRGNSGLETLRRLAVDYVKIDQSIVAGAPTDVNAAAVLVAIVAYARRTGAFVIAEGIESEEILAYVRNAHEMDAQELAIEGGQGFLLGEPATAPTPPPVTAR